MILHLELDLTVYLSPVHPSYPPSREEMLAALRQWLEGVKHVTTANGTKFELSEKDILDVEEVNW